MNDLIEANLLIRGLIDRDEDSWMYLEREVTRLASNTICVSEYGNGLSSDIAHEVMLALLEKDCQVLVRTEFHSAKMFFGYVKRMVITRFLDHRRRSSARIHREETVHRERETLSDYDAIELKASLSRYIDALDPSDREVICHILDDRPVKEYSHIHNISVSGVHARISRARKQLRNNVLVKGLDR